MDLSPPRLGGTCLKLNFAVLEERFELSQVSLLAPKASASASSATPAKLQVNGIYRLIIAE